MSSAWSLRGRTGGVLLVLVLMAGACTAGSEAPARGTPAYRVIATQGMSKFVVVAPSVASSRDSLAPIVADLCGQDQFCNLLFWEEESRAARRFPMSDDEMAALVSKYERNRTTRHDRYVRWSDGESLP